MQAGRLYHRPFQFPSIFKWIFLAGLACLVLAGCAAPQKTQTDIMVQVNVDNKNLEVQVPVGSSVADVLAKAGVTLSALDRSEPPVFTILSSGNSVKIIRVREKFEIEQQLLPFEHQTIRNESLREGESRLSQPGANGEQEITYRILLEDGVEISRTIVKTVTLKDAVPEILLVGSQTPFQSLPIHGRLAYLSAGNAWIMEGTTGERRIVVNTADLDGRVFALSPDGRWLVFTRSSKDAGSVNTLWAARVDQQPAMLDLKVSNIIHFAAFADNNLTLAFSTVEIRSTAPGWQANNNLLTIDVSTKGILAKTRTLLDINSGGVYGWWGSSFSWAPGGKSLADARPDGIGLIDAKTGSLSPLIDILPLQTGGDWAWVPGLGWSPDGKILYIVNHSAKAGDQNPEQSPNFDVTAVSLVGGPPVALAHDVGMFAYPAPSPLFRFNPTKSQIGATAVPTTSPITGTLKSSTNLVDGNPSGYQVAYLQALVPLQSDTSRYRLAVMDQDGSNKQLLFPDEGLPGLEPQRIVWSPVQEFDEGSWIGVIYQGNIWLVNSQNGQAQQITGDGLISRTDWR